METRVFLLLRPFADVIAGRTGHCFERPSLPRRRRLCRGGAGRGRVGHRRAAAAAGGVACGGQPDRSCAGGAARGEPSDRGGWGRRRPFAAYLRRSQALVASSSSALYSAGNAATAVINPATPLSPTFSATGEREWGGGGAEGRVAAEGTPRPPSAAPSASTSFPFSAALSPSLSMAVRQFESGTNGRGGP